MKECTSKENKISGVIFKYLDNKNFVFKETAENYYLLDNENDIYCQVRLRKTDMVCFIEYKLIREVERFFCMNYHIVENIIGEYVENTMNIKVSNTNPTNTRLNQKVENTMNIKVSNTHCMPLFGQSPLLRIQNIKVFKTLYSVYENTITIETPNNVKVSKTKSLVNIET